MKTLYFNNLPHYQPVGTIFFITFSLYGSMPTQILEDIKAEKQKRLTKITNPLDRYSHHLPKEHKKDFASFDDLLDKNLSGPQWLKDSKVANIVKHKIHSFDKKYYSLLAYCIMSNHVHLLVDTAIQLEGITEDEINDAYIQLYDVLKLIKGATACEANKVLRRKGSFWQKESYDHIVSDDQELKNSIDYILQNPVKAVLVDDWQKWPHSYVNEKYL
jgi:putative transposase